MKKLIKKQNGGLVKNLLEENEKSKWMTQYPTTKYDRKPVESTAEKYRRFKNTPIESSNLTSYGLPIPGLHHTSTLKNDALIIGTASVVPVIVGSSLTTGVIPTALTTIAGVAGGLGGSLLGSRLGNTSNEKEMYSDILGLTGGILGYKASPYIQYPIEVTYKYAAKPNVPTGFDLIGNIRKLRLPGKGRGTVGSSLRSVEQAYNVDPAARKVINKTFNSDGRTANVYLPTSDVNNITGPLFIGYLDTTTPEIHFGQSGPRDVMKAVDIISALPKGTIVSPNSQAVPIWYRLRSTKELLNHLLSPTKWEIPGRFYKNAQIMRPADVTELRKAVWKAFENGEIDLATANWRINQLKSELLYIPPASADAVNLARTSRKIGLEPHQSRTYYQDGVNPESIHDKVLGPLIQEVRDTQGSSLYKLNDYLKNKLGYTEPATYKNGEVRIPFTYYEKTN